jgi:hypothetical protein
MRAPRRTARALALAAAALLVAACGSTAGGAGPASRPAPAASLPLATSLGGPGQPGWAVVAMGGSAATHESFWELFSRAAGSGRWKLATPPGVASNGGLVVAAAGAGLTAGFRPSQDLTFSPLAAIASPAASWSQGSALVSPGLASVPDSLAAGPAGRLLALTSTGQVLLGADGGSTWTQLANARSVARTGPGRACGLTTLTAVAFAADGAPLLAGTCTRPGAVGIFIGERGTTVRTPLPALPAGAAGPVTVLGLTTLAGRTMALIQAGTGSTADVFAAWLAAGAGAWTVSAAVPAGGGAPRSQAMWAGGSAALVLAGGRAEAIAGPGGGWRSLPALPAGTATLALGPAGQLEALAAEGGSLSVWQLTPGGAAWSRLQQIRVTIPYGSSS